MDIEQAIEMAEALNLDNERGLTTLGEYGDEVAVVLLREVEELRAQLSEFKPHSHSERWLWHITLLFNGLTVATIC